jgi:hypothetical protein
MASKQPGSGQRGYSLPAFGLLIGLIGLGLVLVGVMQPTSAEAHGPGAIWTTRSDCGAVQQQVNSFSVGEQLYINASGFSSHLSQSVPWSIVGQPGGASNHPNIQVASGTAAVDAGGAFCIAAYVIQPADGGVYKVTVDVNKQKTYSVAQATATNTSVPPAATNTSVPPTATNTSVPPTATNTSVPPTATNTSVPPTATNTSVPPTATNTSVPPTATNTSVPPTATNTPMTQAVATATNTPVTQAVATATPVTFIPDEAIIVQEVQAIVVTPTPVPPTPVPPTPTLVAEVAAARLPTSGTGGMTEGSNSALIIGLTLLALGALLFGAGNLARRPA